MSSTSTTTVNLKSSVRDEKDSVGCAIFGLMSEDGRRFPGDAVTNGIAVMHDRSSGLGGGFAAYGICPNRAKLYAFHMMFDFPDAVDTAWRVEAIVHEDR